MFTYDSDPSKQVDRAFEILKTNPHFPVVQFEVMDRIDRINAETGANIPFSTPERLEYVLKIFDARAEPYLKLVSSMTAQEAYATLLDLFARITWDDYMGFVGTEPLPGNNVMAQINSRKRQWMKESYRKAGSNEISIAESPRPSSVLHGDRRGFRTEVQLWMRQQNIATIEIAAKRLAVSKSTLKSIMSDRGKLRCSEQTLNRVLQTVGVSDG